MFAVKIVNLDFLVYIHRKNRSVNKNGFLESNGPATEKKCFSVEFRHLKKVLKRTRIFLSKDSVLKFELEKFIIVEKSWGN